MPKLVAFYLKEFSVRTDETTSTLYKFVFCLCLPFLIPTFRKARLNALAIAECTNSFRQIARVLNKLTGATVGIVDYNDEYRTYYELIDSDDIDTMFTYDDTDVTPRVPYSPSFNEGVIIVLDGYKSREEVEAYMRLLAPFYVKYEIRYEGI